jgi:tRNA threonylcarbamoyladenosine biosynthesis protein TsaE
MAQFLETIKVVGSLDESIALGSSIGANLRGGELIKLVSDLGGGKTTFVRGLAKGMGSSDRVHSPSFTISNQYSAGGLWLYHFDFYRLTEPGIMQLELDEVINDPKVVIVIEWADIVTEILPKNHITVSIEKADLEFERIFKISYPEELSYCLDIGR